MPSYNKPGTSDPQKTDAPFSVSPKHEFTVAEQDSSKAGKRKTKNAAKQLSSKPDNEDKLPANDQMGHQNPSILNQLHGFPPSKKNTSLDELGSSQKVSDEATPPIDVWSRAVGYGRSPPADSIPGLSIAGSGSPTIEPGFSSRGVLNSRSPPISPPLRKARPVSYGSGVPPIPSHPRVSTSPYGYNPSAYGSPPVPPHLPQQHFYGAHDVDLGLPRGAAHVKVPDPVALRFGPIPGSRHESRDAAFFALEGGLAVLSYNGERIEHIGALQGIQGTIVDATFLTWAAGHDPFAEYRPLVAITVHGVTGPEKDPRSTQGYPGANEGIHETRVVVYSLSRASPIAELLRIPSPMSLYPGGPQATPVAANLRVDASGNFITVTSGTSGELYVFTIRRGRDSAVFECLGKYWTTIQSQPQRRDSSHGRPGDTDVSPADLGRASDSEDLPILSLNGRWLAYCPATTPSRPSIGAVLGDFVVHNKNSHISAGTAPSRPLVNCEVDSPYVDTFLGKVAKGFAQEAVRSARWISEKGMQTWQNYWKKDSLSPGNPSSSSSSPPVYTPPLGLAQFPPTHATDSQNASREPEIVTILDLKLLQDVQSRKNVDLTLMTTFQPPGGCSFVSFMPTGLGLMTANRKGDIQYIWDLMQIKYAKLRQSSSTGDSGRVRQIARYERLSPSTILDIAWDGPNGHRFALLTKNKTVHIFDLPKTAFLWPPPRVKRHRPVSVPADSSQTKSEPDQVPSGSFFASAMSIAGRTQPMLANLRGRAPSMGGGISGIGATGIGLASTTGIKGGRAVAAGLSKSLGAASETVTSIRHANQSRLHLKTNIRQGTLVWQKRDGRSVLSVLDSSSIKVYYVRMTKPRENRQRETVSVFDARKALATKIPKAADLLVETRPSTSPGPDTRDDSEKYEPPLGGFWKVRSPRDATQRMPHPLACAEIDTNAPYQPFHSDHRVTISLIHNDPFPNYATPAAAYSANPHVLSQPSATNPSENWVFGGEIKAEPTTLATVYPSSDTTGPVIYRETKTVTSALSGGEAIPIEEEVISHVVSNTKKKKKKNKNQPALIGDDDQDAIAAEFLKQEASYDPEPELLDQASR